MTDLVRDAVGPFVLERPRCPVCGGPGLEMLHRLLRRITTNQETIMTQLSDLQAALDAANGALDAIAPEVATTATEVQTLIAKLGNLPPSVDLTAALASANLIQTKVTAIDTALKAIPSAS